jgi:hypothetical protein
MSTEMSHEPDNLGPSIQINSLLGRASNEANQVLISQNQRRTFGNCSRQLSTISFDGLFTRRLYKTTAEM